MTDRDIWCFFFLNWRAICWKQICDIFIANFWFFWQANKNSYWAVGDNKNEICFGILKIVGISITLNNVFGILDSTCNEFNKK